MAVVIVIVIVPVIVVVLVVVADVEVVISVVAGAGSVRTTVCSFDCSESPPQAEADSADARTSAHNLIRPMASTLWADPQGCQTTSP